MLVLFRTLGFAALGAVCAGGATFLDSQSPWVAVLAPGLIFAVAFAVLLWALQRLTLGGALLWMLAAVFAYVMALFIFFWTAGGYVYSLSMSWPLLQATLNQITGLSLNVETKVATRIVLSFGGAFSAWFGIGILIRQHKRLVAQPNAGWPLCAVIAGGALLGVFMMRLDDYESLPGFLIVCQTLFGAALGATLPAPKSKAPVQPQH